MKNYFIGFLFMGYFMNKTRFKKNLLIVVETIMISGITIISALPISCKITATGIEIVGGDYTAPVLETVTVIDESTVKIDFSETVTVKQAVVSPVLPGISDSNQASCSESLAKSIGAALGNYDSINVNVHSATDDNAVIFKLEEKTDIGQNYQLFGVVEDSIGNSLCFSVLFKGFNPVIPKIIMTELHTGMAGQLKSEKEENVRRLEYVEFLALSDGNLAGLEFCSSYAGESKKYEFPTVSVTKGECFVLHLRNWGEGCISETGDDLQLAYSKYTGLYRDLWTDQTTKCIGDNTDVIILRNSVTDKVVDAVMYRAEEVEEWDAKLKSNYSLCDGFNAVYEDYSVENGTVSTGLSATKYLSRKNSSEIYKAIMNNEEIEYPVKAYADSWEVISTASPGSL